MEFVKTAKKLRLAIQNLAVQLECSDARVSQDKLIALSAASAPSQFGKPIVIFRMYICDRIEIYIPFVNMFILLFTYTVNSMI